MSTENECQPRPSHPCASAWVSLTVKLLSLVTHPSPPCSSRFHAHYFDEEKKQRVREMTQKELTEIETSGEGRDSTGSAPQTVPEKRSRTSEEAYTPSLSEMFDEILQESTPIRSGVETSAAAQQIEMYLAEQPIARSDNPLDYWRANKVQVNASK